MNYDVTFEEHNEEFDVDFGENVNIGGGTTAPPDEQMSDTSTNAVQNKVIKKYVDAIASSVQVWSSEQHRQIERNIETFMGENLVFKEKGKGLSTNDFTNDDKSKLDESVSREHLEKYVDEAIKGIDYNYTLPVGGDEIGGVKNGGNVVINEDGTMTAPTGGSNTDEEWEHICDIPVVEDTGNPITKIEQDLGAKYKKLYIFIDKNSSNGLVASGGDSYPLRIFANRHNNNAIVGQFGQKVISTGWSIYSCEIDYNIDTGLITSWSSIGSDSHYKVVNNKIKDSISKLILVNNTNPTTGGGFKTFTINIYGVRV